MESETILKQFREKVSEKITLKEKGMMRYIVQTPFLFEDGDHVVIVLKYAKEVKKWRLTDEGHTFMHLSYFMDIKDTKSGTRQEIIKTSKMMFGVEEKDGELFLFVRDDKFGDALFDFVQALLKIMDVTFLERDRVASTFFGDFRVSLNKVAKKRKLDVQFNFYVDKDKKRMYPIDACIKQKNEEFFIFAINNDNTCMKALISLMRLELWKIKFHSVGIFEDLEKISPRILAKFTDIAEKQISSLDQIERFEKFIENH
ncbi:hypothetical protein A3K73_03870 [Candidatus Pacearchaeota archaeon RBG_13_36_9]|nr:MAG: hypothetical protein A3K73_03870 [Candidatus Pacearchaeota archaeon RBG_13_36_9]HJX50525.1 DUF1828 domain-containing protein [Candidatus Nanoarchaeia archaeon]